MEAEHTSLLYYCETRWPSRAKVGHKVFELKEEGSILYMTATRAIIQNLFYNGDYIQTGLFGRHSWNTK